MASRTNIDERMCESIHYALSILKRIHPTSAEFNKEFNKTMFLKPNTEAFIHVTQFLFTLLDNKEFQKKFYWPIHDKRAESAYRSESPAFIDTLSEKHKLKLGKTKPYLMHHPGGVKFMEIILTLVNLALKEELIKHKSSGAKNLDLQKAKQKYSEMVTMGRSINSQMKLNVEMVHQNTCAEKIFQKVFRVGDLDVACNASEVCNFLNDWNKFNISKFNDIQMRIAQMDSLTRQANTIFYNATKLLESKCKEIIYSSSTETIVEILTYFIDKFPDASDFLKNNLMEENKRINFKALVELLQLAIPDMIRYINNFLNYSSVSSNTLQFETRELSKMCKQTSDLREEVAHYCRRYGMDVVPITNDFTGDGTKSNDVTKKLIPYMLSTPQVNFDCTENCTEQPIIRKTRLPLVEDNESQINRTKLFRIHQIEPTPKRDRSANLSNISTSTTINKLDATAVMCAPQLNQIKRRRDPFAMLGKVKTNCTLKGKPTNIRTSMPLLLPNAVKNQLSSTMLGSPDQRTNQMMNFSSISGFSISKISPVVPEPLHKLEKKNLFVEIQQSQRSPVSSKVKEYNQQELTLINEFEEISISSASEASIIERTKCPKTVIIRTPKLKPAFQENHLSPSGKLEGFLIPRISIALETLAPDSVAQPLSSSFDKENNKNVSNLVFEFDEMNFKEEQLLNISDSVLDVLDE